jgi:hypothetical protein
MSLHPVRASSVIAALCHELQIACMVNAMVQWDERQWWISPGTLTVGLIINLLVDRRPLYRIQAFYEGMDTEMLFAERFVTADCFNDDALSRTLTRLAASDA